MSLVRMERFIGRLVISLIFLVLMVFVADLIGPTFSVSYKNTQKEMHEKLVAMAPVPYSMTGTTFDESLRAEAKLNALGFKGKAPSLEKKQGEKWVFLLGGSTVYYGSPSLAELMEQQFAREGHPEIRCFNFGVPTSLLRSDIARFVFTLSEFQPDLLLFYGLGNDIILPFQGDSRPGFPFNFVVYENNPLYLAGTARANRFSPILQFLYQSSTLRILFGPDIQRALLPASKDVNRVLKQGWSQSILASTIADIHRVKKIEQGFEIPTAVVFQPLVYFRPQPTETERGWIFPELTKHARFMREGLLKEFRQPSYEGFFFDLSGIFDSESHAVFLDGIHIQQEYFPPIAQGLATIALRRLK